MDEFWEIQLEGGRSSPSHNGDNADTLPKKASCGSTNIKGYYEESAPISRKTMSMAEESFIGSTRVYSFPWDLGGPQSNGWCVYLQLTSLPRWSGVFSPLGADPWYASALLASLLLLDDGAPDGPKKRLHCHLHSCPRCKPLRVLELGSGAVGISAFAAVLSIVRHRSNGGGLSARAMDEVILTDNEPDVLRQLKLNTTVAAQAFDEMRSSKSPDLCVPNMRVHKLDWGDDVHEIDLAPFHLAIGAELVYTPFTATACFNVVQKLLDGNSNILIVIVQVADREGWYDTFLPKLESIGALVSSEQLPIEIYGQASTYVEHGGTSNVLRDYEVCFITSREYVFHEDFALNRVYSSSVK